MSSSDPDSAPAAGTRAVLLAAALAELAEHGHAGISLRAVARRAGVSHAAPKHHFGDRAGLLTAVATRGFLDLAAGLDAVEEDSAQTRLAALGQAYIDFGLSHPALFDLMFRTVELDAEDEALGAAQAAAIGHLAATAARVGGTDRLPPPTLTVLAWALVHGLVVLTRDGALRDPDRPDDPAAAAALAHHVTAVLAQLTAQSG